MKTSRNDKHTERQEIQNIPSGLTLNNLLENTKQKMGKKKFFTYNAVSNNCQDFLLAFLQSNNLGNEPNYTFIKQDTKSLFDGLPVLKKLAKGTTDLGAAVGDAADSVTSFFTGRGLPQDFYDANVSFFKATSPFMFEAYHE